MFLLRDLVSPRTWLAMTSHLAGLFIGIAGLIFVVTFGLSFGFSLLVRRAGRPADPGPDAAGRRLVRHGRAGQARLHAGGADPGLARGGPGRVPVGLVPRWRMFASGRAGAKSATGCSGCRSARSRLTVSVAFWSAGLVMLALPLYNRSLPSGGAELGDTVLRGTPTWRSPRRLGLVVLIVAAQLTRGLAIADAAMSRRLLGPRERPGRPGDRTGDQPGAGGGRGRGGAAADRA